jgi:hypothetical protein
LRERTPEQAERFDTDGFLVLHDVFDDDELAPATSRRPERSPTTPPASSPSCSTANA